MFIFVLIGEDVNIKNWWCGGGPVTPSKVAKLTKMKENHKKTVEISFWRLYLRFFKIQQFWLIFRTKNQPKLRYLKKQR